MKKKSTATPRKGIKISAKTWRLYEQRDKSKDHDDPPQISPAVWAQYGVLGKYYRPLKTPIAIRIDNDVLAWLKADGPGYQGRINALLRQAMENSIRKEA
jgi:uncharacterized protein (DUF4415 family)